jgi:hypothetical protein
VSLRSSPLRFDMRIAALGVIIPVSYGCRTGIVRKSS